MIQITPFVIYKTDGDQVRLGEGIETQIILIIIELLNMTYSVIDCNNHWGSQYPNGSWSGLMGQLVTNVS